MPRWSWGLPQASELLTPPVPTRSRPCLMVALPPLKFPLAGVSRKIEKAGLPCDLCSYDQCFIDNVFPAVTEPWGVDHGSGRKGEDVISWGRKAGAVNSGPEVRV